MPEALATALVNAVTLYLAAGAVLAPAIAWVGVRRLDPAAARATRGFKLLILPGIVLFWPLLLVRWIRGDTAPPEERNAHRLAARQRTGP